MSLIRVEGLSTVFGPQPAQALHQVLPAWTRRRCWPVPATRWRCTTSTLRIEPARSSSSWACRVRASRRWCGTSTGSIEPTAGRVLVDGQDVAALDGAALCGCAASALGDGFPALRSVAATRCSTTWRWDWNCAACPGRRARPGTALDRAVGLAGVEQQLPGTAFGWDAAAHGPGAGAVRRHRHRADGRSLLGAGPADPCAPAGRAAGAAGEPGPHHRVRHPRPGRSAAPGQPHRPSCWTGACARWRRRRNCCCGRPTRTWPRSCAMSTAPGPGAWPTRCGPGLRHCRCRRHKTRSIRTSPSKTCCPCCWAAPWRRQCAMAGASSARSISTASR